MRPLTSVAAAAVTALPLIFGAASGAQAGMPSVPEAGKCGPMVEVGKALRNEGQAAFAMGRRYGTEAERKKLGITGTSPADMLQVHYGLLYFSNADGSVGYVVHTDSPLNEKPTQICIDSKLKDLKIADPSTTRMQDIFSKSGQLAAYLDVVEKTNEHVLMQASLYNLPGYLVTATADMMSPEGIESTRGDGTLFITRVSDNATQKLFGTFSTVLTPDGKNRLRPPAEVADATPASRPALRR